MANDNPLLNDASYWQDEPAQEKTGNPLLDDSSYWSDEPEPKKENESWAITKGVKAGADQLQALGGGAVALAGDFAGSDKMKDWGMDVYQRNMEEAGESSLDYGFTDIDSIGRAAEWAGWTLGNVLPTIGASMAGGGVGGLAVKQLSKKAIAEMLKAETAKGVSKEAAEKIVGQQIAKRVAMGQAAGAGATSIGMESGSIYGDTGDAGVSLAHGTVAGMVDALPVTRLLNKLGIGKEVTDGIKQPVIKEGLKQGVFEGGTEALQTFIEQHAKHWVESNGESLLSNVGEANFKEIADAAAAGFLGGKVLGSGAQYLGNRGLPESAENEDVAEDNSIQIDPALNAELKQLPPPPVYVQPVDENQIAGNANTGLDQPAPWRSRIEPDAIEKEVFPGVEEELFDLESEIKALENIVDNDARLKRQNEIELAWDQHIEQLNKQFDVDPVDEAVDKTKTTLPYLAKKLSGKRDSLEAELLNKNKPANPVMANAMAPVIDGLNEQRDLASLDAEPNEQVDGLPASQRIPEVEAQGLSKRYAFEDYRAAAKGLVDQLVPGGGVSYLRDENDRITGRTSSLNPDWFQGNDDMASVKYVQETVQKALAGEKLGAKQRRIMEDLADHFDEQQQDFGEYGFFDPADDKSWYDERGVFRYRPESGAEPKTFAELEQEAREAGVSDESIRTLVAKNLPLTEHAEALYDIVQQQRTAAARHRRRSEAGAQRPDEKQARNPRNAGTQQQGPEQQEANGPVAQNDQRPEPEGLALDSYSEADLQTVEAEKALAPAKEQKAQVDREREHFALTGEGNTSMSAANRTAATPDLFSAPSKAAIDKQAHEAATSPLNDRPEPTDAQKEAGNYKKGRITVHGIDIAIENPKGSKRSGTDPDGNRWENTIHHHYGDVSGTRGADGDPIDVFVGEDLESDKVFVIDQVNKDGTFDEHKVMLGFGNKLKAIAGYKKNYDKGWKVGPVTTMSVDEFKAWTKEGDTTKPLDKALDMAADAGKEVIKEAVEGAEADDGRKIRDSKKLKAMDANTKDAGAELVANRRDFKGFGVDEIRAEPNATKKLKMATKAKIWERPDYQSLVGDGMDPISAYMVKAVYDAVGAKVAGNSDEQIESYVQVVSEFRDGVVGVLKSDEVQSLLAEVDALMKLGDYMNQYKASDKMQAVGEKLLDLAFPKNESGKRWGRSNMAGNAKALTMGKDFSRKINLGLKEYRTAQKAIKDGWPAKQEAWQKSFRIEQKDGRFHVKQKNRYSSLSDFASIDEAIADARERASSNRKVQFKEPSLELPHIIREGRDRREGRDVSTQDLLDTFGFRGVNFGNWMKGEKNAAERQAHLNHIYDSMLDLAEILSVPPKALSLDGMLGVAVGAQGRGGNAAAHFVAGVNEINITRKSGAGSLAHEWGHAMDHYFGIQADLDRDNEPFLTEHVKLGGGKKVRDAAIRNEVTDAFMNVVRAMNDKAVTKSPEEMEASRQNSLDKAKQSVERYLSRIEGMIKKEAGLSEFQAIAEKLKGGERGEYVKLGRSSKYVGENINKLRELVASSAGRAPAAETFEYLDSSVASMGFAMDAAEFAKVHQPQRITNTNYSNAAKLKDAGKQKPYWNTQAEKFARAFESYVLDRLADAGNRADYLTAKWKDGSHPNYTKEAQTRYPQAEERAEINKAFDDLFETIESKETESGVALYSLGTGTGLKTGQVRLILHRLQKETGVPIEVVATNNDLPASLRKQISKDGQSGNVQGIFDTESGIAYISAANLSSAEDAVKTYLHEIVAHRGIRAALGDKLDQTLDQVYRSIPPKDLASLRKEYAGQLEAAGSEQEMRHILADEYIAKVAESDPKNSLLDKVVAAIRDWLRRLFPSSAWAAEWSRGDIVELLAKGKRALREAFEPVPDGLRYSRSNGWAGFPDAVIAHRDVQDHPDYKAAKAGDENAAIRLAMDAVTDDFVADIEKSLNGKKADIVPVLAEEAAGNNKIPMAVAQVLAAKLGVGVEEEILQAGKVSRSGSSGFYRLANQPNFTGDFSGKRYIILDDTLAQGGTLAQLKEYIESSGGEVVLAAALTGKQYSAKIALSSDMLESVREQYASIEPWFKQEFGYDFSGLTQSEARYIVKSGASPDALRTRILEARHEALRETDAPTDEAGGNASSTPKARYRLNDTKTQFVVPEEKIGDKLIRIWQDKFKPLKRTQAAIESLSGPLSDEENTYMAEEAFHGKTEKDLKDVERDLIQPLVDDMVAKDIEQEELDLYLIAKHAKERNDYIASINPDMPDGGSGMSTAKAERILAMAKSEGKSKALDSLADKVYAITKRRRDLMRESGLQADAQTDAWEEMYQNYVPLKGFAENEVNEQHPRIGSGFDIRGKESMKALGRRTMAESPTLHAIKDLTESVIRNRKNEVGQTFLNLVENHPNPDYWEVFTDENPDIDRRMVNGQVKEVPVPMHMMKDKYFAVKVDGKERFIKIKDERLMAAMKNMGPEPSTFVTKYLGTITRFLSSVNTSYNPEFLISNAARDIQTALYNALAEQDLNDGKVKGKKIAGKMVKGVPKAIRAIWATDRNKELTGEAAEIQQYYREFLEDGAKTGYFDSKPLDKLADDLGEMVSMAKGGAKGNLLKFRKRVLDFVDMGNGAVENGVRLSAYIEARKAGISRKKAASFSKNLTVNFNRRGEVGTVLNSMYMFANASIQGTANFARAIASFDRGEDGKVKLNAAQKAAAGMVAGAFFLSLWNREVGGEDDDGVEWYDKVPDYVRERNIVIMKSGFGGEPGEYWTIPLPYGYNIFYNIGDTLEGAFRSDYKPRREGLLWNVLLSGVNSFSPLGVHGGEPEQAAVLTITPTVLAPFAEIGMNTNHFGGAIYKENYQFGAQKADAALSMRSTKEAYKHVAEFLNEVTGGSDYRSGVVDISPDTLEHLTEYGLGGLYSLVMRTAEVVDAKADDRELDDRNIPFYRKLSGKIMPYEDVSRFYEARQKIDNLKAESKTLSGKERGEFLQENRDAIRLQFLMKSSDKKMKALREKRDQIESNEKLTDKEKDIRLREIERKMKAVVDNFNERWDKAG